MKKKYIYGAALGLSASLIPMFTMVAYAEDGARAEVQVEHRSPIEALRARAELMKEKREDMASTSLLRREREEREEMASSTATSTDERGRGRGEERRSIVANFVHRILGLATTTKEGIGEQVREVAKEQHDADTATSTSLSSRKAALFNWFARFFGGK